MIKITDIKEELIRLLRIQFPDCMVYGIEVIEGYDRPSFFVDIRLVNREQESVNLYSEYYNVSLTYFQESVNEADNHSKLEGITDMLISKDKKNRKKTLTLNIKDRFLPVTGLEMEYIGERNNILQINFDLRFFNAKEKEDEGPNMGELILNKGMEVEI